MTRLPVVATYPVLPEAKVWLREHGPALEALVSDIVYNRARDRARRMVRGALEGRPPEEAVLLGEIEAEMELVAQPLARLLVAAVDDAWLSGRYAVVESKRLSAALEQDPGEIVGAVAEALGVSFRSRDDEGATRTFGLTLPDYLRHSPNERNWHIIHRDPHHGVVWLSKPDFARLLESVYKRRLEGELAGRGRQVPALVHETFADEIGRLKAAAAEHAARYKRADLKEVVPGAFPPCMRRILKDMHEHVNVPHMGRFAIVSFLHTLGQDSEEILKFFSTVPDFDPEKSRYQIEHITGKGGPTQYTPPGCDAMQTYGVCPLEERDDLCHQIRHPLAHYRRSLARHAQQNAEPKPQQKKEEAPDKKVVAGGSA